MKENNENQFANVNLTFTALIHHINNHIK